MRLSSCVMPPFGRRRNSQSPSLDRNNAGNVRKRSGSVKQTEFPKLPACSCRWRRKGVFSVLHAQSDSTRKVGWNNRRACFLSNSAALSHGGLCMAAQLRVYPSSAESDYADLQEPTVGVRFADLLPLVALAQ